ncbi:MAG: hypothetical protein HY959_05540 [Ignavibacteriae bacterium]|nr:hypothetical protein [Ignavibacteriota bacterium]
MNKLSQIRYFFLIFILLIGCTSVKEEVRTKNKYEIISIDYGILDDICVFLLKNSLGENIVLFSNKISKTIIPEIEYQEFNKDSIYINELNKDTLRKNNFIIYSNKIIYGSIPFEKYEMLKKGSSYEFEIYRDTLKYVRHPNFNFNIRDEFNLALYIGDILFIKNDTVKAKIYRSKNIFDKYIER